MIIFIYYFQVLSSKMGSESIGYLQQISARAHFSGFKLDDLQPINLETEQSATFLENTHRQPFIIGIFFDLQYHSFTLDNLSIFYSLQLYLVCHNIAFNSVQG